MKIRSLAVLAVALFAGMSVEGVVHAQPQLSTSLTAPQPLPITAEESDSTRSSPRAETRKRDRNTARTAGRTAPPPRTDDATIRGNDNIDLIARLPWWRSSEEHTLQYLDRAVSSQVLTAARSFAGVPLESSHADENEAQAEAVSSPDEAGIEIADPSEVNALDLLADEQPAPRSWFHGFLAILGGAIAAASAARFLFI